MSSTPQAEGPPRHPLFGELLVIPPEHEAEAVVARMRHWDSSLKPWDLVECWQSQQIARETIRLERLHQREIAARYDQALGAGASWEQSQADAAESLAAGLSRHPAHTLALLRRSKQGCELIARRWDALLVTLDRRGAWSDRERLLALNLLNVPPELRESVTPLDAPDGDDPVAHLRCVAAREIGRHLDLAADLTPLDAHRRETVRLGLGPDTPELAVIRKEERASSRLLAWCRAQFKTSRPDPRPVDPGDLPASTPPKTTQESPLPKGGPPLSAAAWKASHASPLAAWKAAQVARSTDSSEADSSEAPDPPRSSPQSRSRRRA